MCTTCSAPGKIKFFLFYINIIFKGKYNACKTCSGDLNLFESTCTDACPDGYLGCKYFI